jgi:tRNA (adenine9-N1/guanine9-N1)-methyltransferase
MYERGWERISSRTRLSSSRLSVNPFQEIAVRALVWGGGFTEYGACGGLERFSERYRGRRFTYHGWGCSRRVDVVYTHEGSNAHIVAEMLAQEPRPLIVIDLSQLLDHKLDSEYASLRSQVAATLGAVRLFLWDAHLLLTSVKPGVAHWLSAMLGRARVSFTRLDVGEALEALGVRRVILLDPSAEEPLRGDEVLEADAFIIGGIVDKIPRPGATAALSRLIPWARRRKILLRGSLIGVPNRINAITEIILRARYQTCGDIDAAIRGTMSPHDARLRAYVEISRRASRSRRVDWGFYCELKRWLPLTRDDFLRAARMAHVEVVGSPSECEEAQQRPISS